MVDVPLLTSVAVVCHAKPQVNAIRDVVLLIEAFVDPSALWTVKTAAATRTKQAISGHFRLLRRIAAREAGISSDPYLKQKRFVDALDHAVVRRHTDVAKWLVEEYLPTGIINRPMITAKLVGNLEFIQWVNMHHVDRVIGRSNILQQLSPMSFQDRGKEDIYLMVKWLHEHVAPLNVNDTSAIVLIGAEIGDVKLLEWVLALEKKRTWRVNNVLSMATRNGQVEVLEWAVDHFGVTLNEFQMNTAISSGQLETAQWLFSKGIKSVVPWEISDAILHKHFATAKWAIANLTFEVTELHDYCVSRLAQHGQLDIIQQLDDLGFKTCTPAAMDCAASKAHLDVVKWLHTHRTVGSTTAAMDGAAENGYLNVVKWLDSNTTSGCTTGAMDKAASNGHLEVVQWLHMNRSEGCTTSAMNGAAENGYLAVVIWLHEHRSEGCTSKAMDDAVKSGHLEIVKFLYENRSERGVHNAIELAAFEGHLDVLKWLHLTRGEEITDGAIVHTSKMGRVEALKWLLHHYHKREIKSTTLQEVFEHSPLVSMMELRCDGRFKWKVGTIELGFKVRNVSASCWMWHQQPEDMRALLQKRYDKEFPYRYRCEEFEKIQDTIEPGWRERMPHLR